MALPWINSDGGTSKADLPFWEVQSSCMARAICNVTGLPFKQVWQDLCDCNAKTTMGDILEWQDEAACLRWTGSRTLQGGTLYSTYLTAYMRRLGFEQQPCDWEDMTPLADLASMTGRYVVALYGHATAVIGGVVFDTFDPQKDRRCSQNGIYSYWLYKGA